jgi:BolA protein
MRTRDAITQKLMAAFAPCGSRWPMNPHLHEGHAEPRRRRTHFRLYIVADVFAGKSRIERHRMINGVLSSEFAAGVHALAIQALAPGEDAR